MTIRRSWLGICLLFVAALILSGYIRRSAFQDTVLSDLSSLATPLYIVATVLCAIALIRGGVKFNRLGFGFKWRWDYLWLALGGVVLLQISGQALAPLWELLFGTQRDLQRFADVHGSLPLMLGLLAMSWTVAAFGEEIAFRIVLQGGLQAALGGTRAAIIIALIVQAVIFGLVHLYQGPTGFAGSLISGLIFGLLTLAARGAIWPAALAHGINNSIGIGQLYLGL